MKRSGIDLAAIGTRRFVSLRWKVLLVPIVVMMIATVVVTIVAYQRLESDFSAERERGFQRLQEMAGGLLQQSAARLTQIGNVVLADERLRGTIASARPNAIKAQLDERWGALQVDLDLEVLGVCGRRGGMLAVWHLAHDIGGHVESFCRQARDGYTDRPSVSFTCEDRCVQYVTMPVLEGGETVGWLVVGTGMSDFLGALRRMAGQVDVGLIAAANVPSVKTREWAPFGLEPWNSVVLALSGPPANMELLRYAAGNHSLTQGSQDIQLNSGTRWFDLFIIPLSRLSAGGARVLVIADATHARAVLERNVRQMILLGALVIGSGVVVLLFALVSPLKRLRQTADVLPLLGEGRFEAVRKKLSERAVHVGFDEIDRLDDAARQLSTTLGHLVGNLRYERDFIQDLFNTAEVMILTLDERGRILRANPFFAKAVGREVQTLNREYLVRFAAEEFDRDRLGAVLHNVLSDGPELPPLEMSMRNPDGSVRTVVWEFSRLRSSASDAAGAALLGIGLDVTERKQAEQTAHYLQEFDAITGLRNRGRFTAELESILEQAKPSAESITFILLDVDALKAINAVHGHAEGDRVLKTVGSVLEQTFVGRGLIGRLGGDEFGVVLRGLRESEAFAAAEDIRQQIEAIPVGQNEAVPEHTLVTAAIGIARAPEHGETARDLLAAANMAVEQAKSRGHGKIAVTTPDRAPLERLRQNALWEVRIRDGLATGRFLMVYQPILCLANNKVSRYEALCRLRDENGTLVPPGMFIPVAEQTGLISAIDLFAIRQACRKIGDSRHLGHQISISVNLSPLTVAEQQTIDFIAQQVEHAAIDPASLIIEITETAGVEDFEQARRFLADVKSLGCQLALDDFGSGYASFSYLREMPFDIIKIDGAFVRQLTQNPVDQIFVRALADIAHGANKVTVAEFVEDKATLDLLRALEVDYVQGYYIGKPAEHIEFRQEKLVDLSY